VGSPEYPSRDEISNDSMLYANTDIEMHAPEMAQFTKSFDCSPSLFEDGYLDVGDFDKIKRAIKKLKQEPDIVYGIAIKETVVGLC
jgi:hypothetical protein